MRIAFVSLNQQQLPDAVTPLGLLYVMAATPPVHERVLWDLCFETDAVAALRDRCAAWRPDVIAMGMRNIQNGDYSGIQDNLASYRALVAAAREASPGVPIVLGGAGFSVSPRSLLAHLGADYGIPGEGELAFALLVEALASSTDRSAALAAIPGLLWRVGADTVENPGAGGFVSLDALSWPDRRLFDPRYVSDFGIDSIQTKRGCPLKCVYCTYPIIEGRTVRMRSPADVVDELLAARQANPAMKHFFVVDSVFNLPPRHAKTICREMARRDVDLPWTCYVNPLGFDAELAELMVAAGCAGIEIGSDSGVDRVLQTLRKGFSVDDIRRTHAICAAAGLPDCHTFLLGTPGETLADVHETLDFIVELDPFAAILMPWTDDEEALDAELATKRRSLRDDALAVVNARRRDHPHWIVPALGINFEPERLRWLRERGFSGPLWQHIRGPARRRPSSLASRRGADAVSDPCVPNTSAGATGRTA